MDNLKDTPTIVKSYLQATIDKVKKYDVPLEKKRTKKNGSNRNNSI